MTASLHALGPGRDAGLYYVNDPNREARPRNRDEYYVSDGGGVWWSSGGSVVADGATIDKETFRDLCAGIDPRTGRNLVRGAGAGHRAGWDLTLSAPKSLSLLWASGTPDQRAEIEAMQRVAVEATLDFVRRQQLLEVRLGAGGVVRETPTDLIVGRFDHHTSREGDPNIHTHCVVMNVAGSLDGKHRTLEPEAMYRWEMTIGAAYRAELSHLLAERGFALRPAGRDQIEIAGVDETIIETFSKRSRQIEEAVGDRDRTSGRAKELAALATRGAKSEVPTGAVLEARWREEFEGREATFWRDLLEVGRAARSSPVHDLAPEDGRDAGALSWDGPPLDPVPVEGAGPVAIAASELLRHESVVDRRQVLRRSLVEASRRGIGLAVVEGELQDLQDARALLTLRAGKNAAWTTAHLAKAEAGMLRACERADERNWFDVDAIAQVLEAAKHLSEEQREAVEALTSRDGVSLIEAGAGTGKTTLASAVRDAAARSSLRVIGLAPTWIAADELAKSIGVPAQAVAKWRYDREIGGQQADAATWDANTVILLDEAGMLGTLDMSAVMVAAKDAGAKVIVFGDRRQLEAVAQGSALSAVAGQLQHVETLKVVRRQESEWQRTASLQMGEGRFGEALASYHQHDAIRFAEGSKATIDATIRAWGELRERHGGDVLIVTRSNRDANALNQAARRALREAGHLGEEDATLPSVNRNNKAVELRLAAGDRIRFGANLKGFGIRNGTRALVEFVDPQPDGRDAILRVRLEDGRSVQSLWSELVPPLRGKAALQPPRIVHAYAGTSHSVQGRTADAAVFHVGQRTDARETYVAMTRHRKEARIVVDAQRLMNEGKSDVVPGDVCNDTKLAALVAEAERYDEKENVYTLQHMQPSASTPTASRMCLKRRIPSCLATENSSIPTASTGTPDASAAPTSIQPPLSTSSRSR